MFCGMSSARFCLSRSFICISLTLSLSIFNCFCFNMSRVLRMTEWAPWLKLLWFKPRRLSLAGTIASPSHPTTIPPLSLSLFGGYFLLFWSMNQSREIWTKDLLLRHYSILWNWILKILLETGKNWWLPHLMLLHISTSLGWGEMFEDPLL